MRIIYTKSILLSLFFLSIFHWTNAQDKTTVTATDDDISANLDLEVVAAVFGESKDLEEFEKKLNDPEQQISNLDLNNDGEVDYLRVVDTSKKNTHVITIQAVIGEDKYQDVAVIDVEKDEKGETQVQVVGDVYMYGSNYIVEPIYVHHPPIYVWFWGPYYNPWRSPFYWGYYPPYYRPWRPYPVPYYRNHVRVNINIHHRPTYRHTTVRKSHRAVNMHKEIRKTDYAKQYPNKSFDKRHKDVGNASQLPQQKPITSDVKPKDKSAKPATPKTSDKSMKPKTSDHKGKDKSVQPGTPSTADKNTKENKAGKPNTPATSDKQVKSSPYNTYEEKAKPSTSDKRTGKASTGKQVQTDWKTSSEKSGKNSNVKNNKVSVPTYNYPTQKSNTKQKKTTTTPSHNKKQTRPSTMPSNTQKKATRPSNNSYNRSYNKPQQRPQTRPAPSTRPTTRPAARPATPSKSRR
ncbi:hypothetical protein [Flammeovirga pacifica]|uniref:EF-hand domain-containing protein n=1 Tax=Flammeovirga pacifica TaxID=915059 RepID=A0A1S1YUF2_FLAPC|nr:hypothetical protein [Flammeovirga pacifica]OHX64445.1 hypothetical protein NH26_22935 [Flammeovirga pacifica]